ncbi:MAG: signal peptidase I [Chloroflexota bacterium]
MSHRPAIGCLFEVLETLVLTVVIFFGIQAFVAQPYKVQQGSMENTLLPEQYVLVDKLSPRWDAYSYGDIVVFHPPQSWDQGSDVPFIKRVIGLPGDVIELQNGEVRVNGIALVEPYIFADANGVQQQTYPSPGGATRWVVPVGELFLMGDHRENSADSRNFGPVEIAKVVGRAWVRYWPFDKIGFLPVPEHPELTPSSP